MLLCMLYYVCFIIMQKTSEISFMNSILEERIAILAPFGRNITLNEIERGMLLADLLGLAAKFANKASYIRAWNNEVEKDSIKKM